MIRSFLVLVTVRNNIASKTISKAIRDFHSNLTLSTIKNDQSSDVRCKSDINESYARLIIESDISECYDSFGSNSTVIKLITSTTDFDKSENVINILKPDNVLKNIVDDFQQIYNTCCATVLIDDTFGK